MKTKLEPIAYKNQTYTIPKNIPTLNLNAPKIRSKHSSLIRLGIIKPKESRLDASNA